ncbi:complex 1 protein-domain-containing protein [Ganoderma leucocontextum]|nr:complex 1 protein-domain-containing protein [Ganoderma leucocontextum]
MQQLTLKHFILKQRVLKLYRQAVRATRSIPDSGTRLETISWIREEFERNRHIQDVAVIQDKISSGRRELKQLLPGGNFTSP